MNSVDGWKPEWGGQTLVLDDRSEFDRDSNPSIESFYACEEASIEENSSLIFERGAKSWHAVRSLECPEGCYRKVFIVRYEKAQPVKRMRKRITGVIKGAPSAEDTIF